MGMYCKWENMGTSSINEEFCIAMFDYSRVHVDALHTWVGDV
jgi:hypothetical protein